jgi:hypothetical protein
VRRYFHKIILSGGLLIRRRRGKQRMAAEGAEQLLQACENIVKGQGEYLLQQNVDKNAWILNFP